MSDENKDNLYGLEDGNDDRAADERADDEASSTDEDRPRPFDEPCPNCGAPMRDADQIVCLRCGFDMKSLKAGQTRIEQPSERDDDDDDDTDAEAALLCDPALRGGMGGWKVPIVLAGLAATLIIIGYLAGASGLYAEPDPSWGRRLATALRYVLFTGASTICGVIALYVVAHIDGQRLGDEKLAAARVLSMITLATLVMFVNFGMPSVEFSIEFVLAAAVLYGMSLLYFNVDFQTAGMWFGVFALTQVVLALLGPVLSWMYAW